MNGAMSKTIEIGVLVIAALLIIGATILHALKVPADGFDSAVYSIVAVIVSLVGANGIASNSSRNTSNAVQSAIETTAAPAVHPARSTDVASSDPTTTPICVTTDGTPVSAIVTTDPATGNTVTPLAAG